jgi:uncharacterized protein with von Willebrand factor type A (vWA) domain
MILENIEDRDYTIVVITDNYKQMADLLQDGWVLKQI